MRRVMHREVHWAATLILILAGLRLFSVIFHNPVLGYANQYDTARLSACLDLWPAESSHPEEATPDAPLRHYSIKSVPGARCHFSSEALLAGTLVQVLHNLLDHNDYDIRIIGLSKALFLIVAILFFTWKLRRQAFAQLIHAVVVLIVLADPFNSLYLNTLYTEFSALFGAYLSIVALYVFLWDARVDKHVLIVYALGLLILIFSKNQHILLPWLLVGAMIIGSYKFTKCKYLIMVVALLFIATAMQWYLLQQQHESLAKANIYNALFLTVLPSVENAGQTVEILGLKSECKKLVNTSWYRMRGNNPEQLCPSMTNIGRLSLMGMMMSRPGVMLDLILKSVYQSTAWRIGYVGEVEGEHKGKIGIYDGLAYWSFSDTLRSMPYPLYFAFLLLPFIYALCASFLEPESTLGVESRAQSLALFMIWICMLSTFLIWFVAILGDGFSDLAKHLHLAFNCVMVAWLMAIAHFVSRMCTAVKQSQLFISIGICALSCMLLMWSAMAWPVAVGTLDMPAQRITAGRQLLLTGWVKDPFGIKEVNAFVGDYKSRADIASQAYDVDAMFPISAAFPGRRFVVEIAVPQEPGLFKVELKASNTFGRVTTFDTIWLTASD